MGFLISMTERKYPWERYQLNYLSTGNSQANVVR